mgnify:FL=1
MILLGLPNSLSQIYLYNIICMVCFIVITYDNVQNKLFSDQDIPKTTKADAEEHEFTVVYGKFHQHS